MPTQSNQNNTITFDEFLNSKSIYTLQDLLVRWASREYSVHSKIQLIRSLRQEMLNKKRLQDKLQEMPDQNVSVLRNIIKGIPCQISQQTAIRSLMSLGLLALWPYDVFNKDPRESIPIEIKNLLIEILNIDTRPVEQVISLRNFLNALPDDQYKAAVEPFVDEPATDRENTYHLLIDKEHIHKRIGGLPEQLRSVVLDSIQTTGGLKFLNNAHDLDFEAARASLEQNLLGTVTELPIDPDGLNYQVVLVFTDITEVLIREPSEPPDYDEKASTGIEALVDLTSVLTHLSIEGIRIKQDGSVYKSSLKRLNRLTGDISTNMGIDPPELYLRILEDMGLVYENLGNLVPTDGYEEWLDLAPEERLRDVFDVLPQTAFLDIYLWVKLNELLHQLPAEVPISQRILNSHLLLAFLKDVGNGENLGTNLSRFRDYTAVFSSAYAYIQILEFCGIVDRYLAGGQFVGFQITDIGARVLQIEPSEAARASADEKVLIINPDFECIVFRHGPAWRVASTLGRFAMKEKAEPTAYHFKIDKGEVEAAILSGMTADAIISFLNEQSRTPVPQNVAYSISDWAERIHVVSSFSAIILEAQEKETLDLLMQDSQMQPYIKRRLADKVLILTERITDRKLLDRLRQMGVFVQTA